MNVGKSIKNARKKSGLTQKELAAKLGLATGTIQQYELGKRQPRLDQLRKIADALNVNWTDLVQEEYQGKIVVDHMKRVISNLSNSADKSVSEAEKLIEDSKLKTDAIVSLIQLNLQQQTAEKLLDALLLLNDDGREKAIERVEELTEIPKYQRQPEGGGQGAVNPQEDN